MQQILDLRERMDALETAHMRIDAQFRQLRGYVYAKKGQVGGDAPPPGDADIPVPSAPAATSSKDALRRQLLASGRVVPGKPTSHE